MLFAARALRTSPDSGRKDCRYQKKKAVHFWTASKEAREGGKVSGKAMQGEVEANAKTLGLEKTTTLEEGCIHF